MSDIRISSWNELQEQLFTNSWNEELGRYRSRYAFRGLSDCNYTLETTLARLGGNYANLEHHLLRNFSKYAHRNVVDRDSVWHWLSVAQHYGLPTRLLDWTYSPFIAMHFATANIEKYDTDAAVWAVNYMHVHRHLPSALKNILGDEGANVFTTDMLTKSVNSLQELDTLSTEPFVTFLEPTSLDDRIVNQYAFFSLMSSPLTKLSTWLENHPELWFRVIIPAELKWEIRDKLDQANITERVLFPGMDGLSTWLKRHYSPKNTNI